MKRKSMRRKHRNRSWIILDLIILIAVLIAILRIMAINGDKSADHQPSSLPVTLAVKEADTVSGTTDSEPVNLEASHTPTLPPPTEDALSDEQQYVINLSHGVELRFPLEMTERLQHNQITQGVVIVEEFAMQTDDRLIPLYSIAFGDTDGQNLLGYILEGVTSIPVGYEISVASDDQLAMLDSVEIEEYYALLDTVNVTFETIMADDRFSTEVPVVGMVTDPVEIASWHINLPAGIFWEEEQTNDQYQATFYSTIHEEKIALYKLYVGDDTGEMILGTYDGAPVSITVYDLTEMPGWTEDDMNNAYSLMESVNDLIQVIMESNGFVAQ